jgi:hypothetical protein
MASTTGGSGGSVASSGAGGVGGAGVAGNGGLGSGGAPGSAGMAGSPTGAHYPFPQNQRLSRCTYPAAANPADVQKA